MTFTLQIELGNAAMLTFDDVAEALKALAEKLEGNHAHVDGATAFDRNGHITDANGNKVGTWEAK